MRYYPRDFHKYDNCANGIREFCNNHNIDFRSFAKNGLSEKEILAVKDGYVQKIFKLIKAEKGVG